MPTLVEVSRFTEEEAHDWLESVLWPDGLVCPHCGTLGNAAELDGEAHRAGVYKCRERECREQFTVTVDTWSAPRQRDGGGRGDRAWAGRATGDEGMARHRACAAGFKRRVAEEHPGGAAAPSGLARRHDVPRELLRSVAPRSRGEQARGRRVRRRRAAQGGPARLRGEGRRPRAQGRPAHRGAGPARKGADPGPPGRRRDLLRRARPEARGVRAGRRVMSLAPSACHHRPKGRSPEAARWRRKPSRPRASRRSAPRSRGTATGAARRGRRPRAGGSTTGAWPGPDRARARPARAPQAPPRRRGHGQRPRRPDLPGPGHGHGTGWSGPAPGRGPRLQPRPERPRPPGRGPGRLVAPGGGGLGDRPGNRRGFGPGRAGGGDRRPPARRRRAAPTVPVAARGTLPGRTGRSPPSTGSAARRGGAATRTTTTPRRGAS
jgi:Transposase zinc-ribbon domain